MNRQTTAFGGAEWIDFEHSSEYDDSLEIGSSGDGACRQDQYACV